MSILGKGQSTSSPFTAAPDSFVQYLTGGFEIIATCLLGSAVLLPHCSAVGFQGVHCPASVASVGSDLLHRCTFKCMVMLSCNKLT